MTTTMKKLPNVTFREAYLRLQVSFDAISDYLEQMDENSTPAATLGLTEEEYQLYLSKPYQLEYQLSIKRGKHRIGDYVEGMTKDRNFIRGWIKSIEEITPHKEYLIETDFAFAQEKGLVLEEAMIVSSKYGYLVKTPYREKQ